jgi:DNA-binding LytR/AlgR family response regulator
MNQEHKDTITTRIVSTVFTVLALAIFKPFGLEAWQWMAVVHLLAMGCLGFLSCAITEAILRYIINKPRSYQQGVDYIIRRNLWFQLINTPLVALLICLYRHLVMSDLVPGNVLSWSNFFETLLIIAFCSFAIGLYWRFKFRSKYLRAELEETRILNEQLQHLQQEAERRAKAAEAARILEASRPVDPAQEPQEPDIMPLPPSTVTLAGTTSESVTLKISDLLYIEAVGNYVKIYQHVDGQVRNDMLGATSKQMEEDLQAYPMIVRCHRAFLVNLQQVEQIVSKAGSMQLLIKHCDESLPVSRSNMAQVKEAIKGVS